MVLALMFVAIMPMTVVAADDSTTTTIIMEGPTTVGIGAKQQYKVTTNGGWEESGNATWTIVLGGKMASLAQLSPANGINLKLNGSFFFNLTAPTSSGDFSVTITVNPINKNYSSSTQKVDLKAIEPIVITATLKNSGNVTVNAVPVFFYLNDNPLEPLLIYDTTINMTGLKESKVSYNWTSFSLSNGQHVILVVIDPNNQTISLENGASQMSQVIYFGSTGYGESNAWLWAFVVIMIVLLFLVYRKPAKRKKKKKK